MKHFLLIFVLAVFWWLGGFVAGAGISTFFDVQWTLQCAVLNVIAGMIMLLLITRDEAARQIFYEGPTRNNPGLVIIALLWILPFSLMVAGVIWWLMGQWFK